MKTKNKRIHRSLAALITVGVVLAVILLNVFLSLFLGDEVLTVDMTKESFNEISAESKALLGKINPEENNFTIYFLADKDELQSAEMGYNNSTTGSTTNLWGMRYVWDLAQTFAQTYDFIKVEILHIQRDADKLEAFRSTAGTTFSKQDVIIDNYTQEEDSEGNPLTDSEGNPVMHHNFRICKRDSFYTTDSSTGYAYAFNGDLRFTSTILSLAGANPTVYFVTGHGESVGDGTTLDGSMMSDYGDAQALRDLLFKAGFVTKKINLLTEYRELFDDDSARLLVLYGPTSDFTSESGKVSEIDIMRKFLSYEDHHAMVFFNDEAEDLPNLQEYFWDYWGVRATDNKVVDSGTNSLTPDGRTFLADYETDPYSVGINLTNSLTGMTSSPAPVFRNARALELSEAHLQNNGFYEFMVTTYVGSVFLAPTSSAAVDEQGTQVSDYEIDDQGSVMALSFASRYSNDNREVSNYALFCSGTGFADSDLIESSAYCNSDVLFYAMRLMAKETVPFEIDFKVIEGQALESVDQPDVIAWTVCLCGLVPVTMLVLGTVVFVKRRHR
ncbi:MAG: hypothetical protein ACI3XR_08815 [Eubacteriales bacterium]